VTSKANEPSFRFVDMVILLYVRFAESVGDRVGFRPTNPVGVAKGSGRGVRAAAPP
jgi:hypothetical protein